MELCCTHRVRLRILWYMAKHWCSVRNSNSTCKITDGNNFECSGKYLYI